MGGGRGLPALLPETDMGLTRADPRPLRTAAAGAAAATVWGLIEPLDQRLFRSDYSDIALLGKAFTRRRGWRPVGSPSTR